jgi:hypothetical protein
MSRTRNGQAQAFQMPVMSSVNLVPPAAIEARKDRKVRLVAVAAVAALAVGLTCGEVVMVMKDREATTALAQAQTRVDSLNAKTKEYQEVIDVQAETKLTTEALRTAMAYEIEWETYITALRETLPEGASIVSFDAQGMSATQELLLRANILADPGLGEITMTAVMGSLPDIAEWIERLEAIDGVSDALYTSAQLQDKETGESQFQVSWTVVLDLDALSGDVLEDGELDADGGTADATEEAGE